IMDARIPDNAGNKPCHELIIKEGREAYFSSLPVKDIEKNLNDNGIPSSVSYGADNE
ncbi:TPA: peptidase C15, partial [Campylobacter coli]